MDQPAAASNVSGLIEEATRLMTFEPKLPASFTFRWNGRRFAVAITDAGDKAKATIIGSLGALPYTAENREGRRNLLGLLEVPRTAIATGAYRLGAQGRLDFRGEVEIDHPVTGQAIMVGLVKYLLGAKPYVDLIEELAPKPKRRTFRRP
ncbi:MAG: hypothetical protein FJX47_14775 [Alphaproteobacteria bacterium]|nr:hypothetical protein [Alphaproteobacteria bacterium]